jgi:hypothetical protein
MSKTDQLGGKKKLKRCKSGRSSTAASLEGVLPPDIANFKAAEPIVPRLFARFRKRKRAKKIGK